MRENLNSKKICQRSQVFKEKSGGKNVDEALNCMWNIAGDDDVIDIYEKIDGDASGGEYE